MGILVRRLAIIGIALCVLVVVVYTLTRGDLLNGFLQTLHCQTQYFLEAYSS